MSSIEYAFPSIKLTEQEEKDIISTFSSPVVQKYLKSLTTEDSKELLSLVNLDMSDESLARRHTFLSGKLAVLTTLLSITE